MKFQDKSANLRQLHVNALLEASWLSANFESQLSAKELAWLLDKNSLTEKLKNHCDEFSIDYINQYHTEGWQLTTHEQALIGNQPCLVREVLLLGNKQPWIAARSLLPYTTLSGSEKDMLNLGSTPLGERVFASQHAHRDAIEIAFIKPDQQTLLARRSRLWINDKPLLVAEAFLPFAPIYTQGD